MILRDYQDRIASDAAECLRRHNIAYLAMEPRTGKTLTAFEIVRLYGAKNVLFVTKKKAIKSIEKDYSEYRDHFQCTVINYESVLKCKEKYDLVVCDEAHSLGAYPKPAKRVRDLKRFTAGLPIIYLSATPSPESYSQLYHQFYLSSFSPFAQYRNFYKWASEFVDKKIKYLYSREINDYSDARIADIEPMIKHLFFSQTQRDSGFDKAITERFIYAPMNTAQKLIISRLLRDRVFVGVTGKAVLGDTAVKLQSKIHQLCSGTVIDEDGTGHIVSMTKAERIRDEFAGKKIAIYYKFQAEAELLKRVFPDWTDSPEMFQASPQSTFLGQFLSAREGIRLDQADAIVFYNIDFAYLSYAQAKDRIVSKERTKEAVLYWVFSEGGIEQKIYGMVCKKKDYTNYHFKKDYHVGSNVPGKDRSQVGEERMVLLEVDTDQ